MLALAPHVANLASGGSYAQSQTVSLSACLAGPYYVFVATDVSNTVNALSCQTNNVLRSSAPVQITPNPYPSLEIAGMVLPPGATSGIPWALQWTVTNAGTGMANQPWSDAVYASTQPALDGSALLLGIFSHTNTLPAGSNYLQSQFVSLPGCSPGQYYVFIAADVSNQVDSTSCQIGGLARSTNALSVNSLPFPDLQVAGIGLPFTASAGQMMAVSWSVTNAASAAAAGSWTDSLYLSPNPAFTPANSVFLGAYSYPDPLAPGATYNQVQSPLIPSNVHGTYYLAVVTDSSNHVQECSGENNNTMVSAGTVVIPITIQPDLMVPRVSAPAGAFSGQAVTVTWVVANDGTAATGGKSWYDTLYLSQDQVLDTTDIRLGSYQRPSSLGVNGSYTNSASVLVPPSAAGPYYIFVEADSGGDLYDGFNEADNVGVTPAAMLVALSSPVDLVATNVGISPANGLPGSSVTVTWSVYNNSLNSAPATWTDGIYVSTNTVWDLTAIPLETQNHANLAAGGSYTASWTGTLPALTPGNYHAMVWTDIRNTASETNLSNNTSASANTISVDIPVLVLGQTVTNQLNTGTQQYYKVNVRVGQTVRFNLASAATNSANEMYVRYGAVPDLGNYDFIFSNALAASQQIQIPATQAGWYYLLVRGYQVPTGPATYTLTAQTIPFAITSVTPMNIGDNGQVTITVNGAQFQPGAAVQLASGTNVYAAATNFFMDGTTIKARFFFTNAFHGLYNLVLANATGSPATLTQGVTITTATGPRTQVISGQVNLLPRQGLPFNWNGCITNTGNVDISYLTVSSLLDQQRQLNLVLPQNALASTTIDGNNNTFIIRDFQPGTSLNFAFLVPSFGSSSFNFDIVPAVYSKSDYFIGVATIAEQLRETILSSTNIGSLPAPILPVIESATNWATFFAQALISSGVLDPNETNALIIGESTQATVSTVIAAEPHAKQADAYQDCRQEALIALKDHLDNDIVGAASAFGLAGAHCANFVEALPAFFGCWLTAFVPIGVGLIVAAERDVNDSARELRKCGTPPASVCGIAATSADGSVSGKVCLSVSRDPNEMVGPTGFSSAAFVGVQQPSLYTVHFANETNAAAYSRQISITNTFDPGFDVRSFRLGEIAFGNVTITVPSNRAFYQTRVTAPAPNPTNIVVDVTAGIDVQNRQAFWTLNAIDLNTGQLVTSALQGVLPPDNTNQIGEGHVIYTILPNASDSTDTIVTNQALIVFDTNEPIPTNLTTNTVDGVPPSSVVAQLPSGTVNTNFTVSWFGMDNLGGSGLLDYDVYVSDNGGPVQAWQSATLLTSAAYSGQYGHTYSFYSIAHDNAGNVEAPPAFPEASIYVSGNRPPALQPIADQAVNFTSPLVLTNAATDTNGTGITLTYSLIDPPPGITINPTNGVLTWHPLPSQGGTTNLITVSATDNGVPPLTTSQSFLAVVGDYTALSLGNAVVLGGQAGVEPLYFSSSASVTNLVFSFSYDPTRLANWNLTSLIAQATTGRVSVLSPSLASVNLSFGGGQLFHGTQAVAQLSFQAISNAHSAFVPLGITNAHVLNSAGQTIANDLIQNGRIVLVGQEPLLEAGLNSNMSRLLTLYGKPGASYMTQWKTNLMGGWHQGWRIPLTNMVEAFSAVGLDGPVEYYRAYEFVANPPMLEIGSFTNHALNLLLYGQPGQSYTLQTTTNLSGSLWSDILALPFTNSFYFINGIPATNRAMWFRAREP